LPNIIRNYGVLRKTGMILTSVDKEQRRRRLIDHVLRMPEHFLPTTTLRWTPQGKINTGRPKETWRRRTEEMLTNRRLTWETAKQKAKDRQIWRYLNTSIPICLGH
jgi:hypothetical protein